MRRISAMGFVLAALLLTPVLTSSANAADEVPICEDCVGIIGDSLTYQGGSGPEKIIQEFSDAHYPGEVRVDGKPNRGIAGTATSPSSLEVIRKWRAPAAGAVPFNPKTFVIALGTNNTGPNGNPTLWRNEVNKVLQEIGPGHVVHWIGLGFRDTHNQFMSFNKTVSEMPGLKFHNWNIHVHAVNRTDMWRPADPKGWHMTDKGYVIRNDYYLSVVLAG